MSVSKEAFSLPDLGRLANGLSIQPCDIQRCKALLLVGSYAEGLSTRTSDLDFIVLTNESVTSWGEDEEFRVCQIDGRRIEVLVLNYAGISKIFGICDAENYNLYSLRKLEFIHRLLNGIPLHGREYHDSLIAGRKKSFQRRMADFYIKAGENIFEDIVGCKASGDLLTLTMQTRELARFSFDALLATEGDTYPKVKWRARRIARVFEARPDVVESYLDVEFRVPFDSESTIETWCRHVMALVAQNQLELYFGVKSRLSFEELQRRPEWFDGYIFRHLGRFYIRTEQSLREVNDIAVACMLLLAAKTPLNELRSEMESLCSASGITVPRRDVVADIVSKLKEQNVYGKGGSE
ncbi:nucleotidyltransferase domain-containing protein [Burkholderia sp. BCC0044]|uniref:nucleotidyltransferase domain-containing protein n=1 Tax=Burkholderia sp. BCC0044 TaxID=2676295 RepID=UPI00158F3B45|nr:nucleotidyltransferase domain-containing protein [Burkholderia sp. BCC0044]